MKAGLGLVRDGGPTVARVSCVHLHLDSGGTRCLLGRHGLALAALATCVMEVRPQDPVV